MAAKKKTTRAKVAKKKTTRAKVAKKKTTRTKVAKKKTTRAKIAKKKTTRAKIAKKKTTRTKVAKKKTTRAKIAEKKTTRTKVAKKKTTRAKIAKKKTNARGQSQLPRVTCDLRFDSAHLSVRLVPSSPLRARRRRRDQLPYDPVKYFRLLDEIRSDLGLQGREGHFRINKLSNRIVKQLLGRLADAHLEVRAAGAGRYQQSSQPAQPMDHPKWWWINLDADEMLRLDSWDQTVPRRHLYRGDGLLVTDALRKRLIGQRFRGISYRLGARPGRFRAHPVYELVPTKCLGRGIDHPLVRPSPDDDPERFARSVLSGSQIADDPSLPTGIRQLAASLGDVFQIGGPTLTDPTGLPNADLAFGEHNTIACSDRLYRYLLDHRDAPMDLFRRVDMASTMPHGNERLDDRPPLKNPRAAACDAIDAACREAMKTPLPKRISADSIDVLIARAKRRFPTAPRGSEPASVYSRQAKTVPARFRRLAKYLPTRGYRGPIDAKFMALQYPDPAEYYERRTTKRFTWFGMASTSSVSHGSLMFETSAATMPQDAPVLLWDTGKMARYWPNVATFVEELLGDPSD